MCLCTFHESCGAVCVGGECVSVCSPVTPVPKVGMEIRIGMEIRPTVGTCVHVGQVLVKEGSNLSGGSGVLCW